jgi:hypothetical protein
LLNIVTWMPQMMLISFEPSTSLTTSIICTCVCLVPSAENFLYVSLYCQ